MKKFLLVTVISLITLSTTFAASQITVPWNCKDLATINQAITAAQSMTGKSELYKEAVILRLTIMKNIIEKKITTFAGIKTEVETLVNASNIPNKELKIKQYINAAIMNSDDDNLIHDGAAYVKANPTYFNDDITYYYYPTFTNKLGLTDDEVYTYLITFFKKRPSLKGITPKNALGAVKKFVRVCPNVSWKTQKEDLTYLNRIFTRKLLENKSAWEPVVVQIRTILETY